jgi:hypothetical protein
MYSKPTYKLKNKPFSTMFQNKASTYPRHTSRPFTQINIANRHNTKKTKKQSKQLIASSAKIRQKIRILNIVTKPTIAYAYYEVPFSKFDIRKLNKVLGKLIKEICNIPKSTTIFLNISPLRTSASTQYSSYQTTYIA